MDLKGSLVNTQLRIYPTESLLAFLKTLTDENNIPANILIAIGKEAKEPTDFVAANVQLTSKDFENLNRIKEVVKDKFKSVNDEQDILHGDPKLIDVDSKNSDEGIEVDEANEKTDDKPKEVTPKPPFRTTSDLDWLENDDKKAGEITEEEPNDEVVPKTPFLTTSDIDWLYNYLQKQKSKNQDVPYLYDLLAGANIEVPENMVIKRNPVLEARCVKLRKQQEARDYRKMTKTVDNVRLRFPEDSISYQMKQLNRQLIAIGQFIISIFAGFLFGFRGVEWIVGNLDFGFRLLLGVMCALVIALAEIYFLAKKLNEELNIPETVQLGGPPKFVDEDKYMNFGPTKKAVEKEHQD